MGGWSSIPIVPNLTNEKSAAKEADEGGTAAEPLHRRGRLRGPVRVDARRRGGPLGAGPRRLQPRVPMPPHLHGAGGERYLREVLQVCRGDPTGSKSVTWRIQM